MNYFSLLFKSWRFEQNYDKSREEILELREKKFRKLLKHAYNNSQFYRDYYNRHGIDETDLDDISIDELPPIDKETFIENFDKITTEVELNHHEINEFIEKSDSQNEKYKGEYTIVHSSGSTGEPTYFIYDDDAWNTILAAAFRAGKGRMSIKEVIGSGILEGIRVAYIAATEGRFGGVMAANSALENLGFDKLLLNINSPMEEWKEKILEMEPNVIVGYPSGVKLLCDMLQEDDEVDLDVLRIITAGEPLTDQLREYIESTLDSQVHDIYGASETVLIGLGKGEFDGVYIFDDVNYVEFEKDCIYVTPLYNYSQPLIRYKLTDTLQLKERGQDEELPYTKISKIVGRNEEIMWFDTENGGEDFLHPLVVDNIDVDELANYQFVQLSSEKFKIKSVLEEGISDEEGVKDEIKRQMDAMLKEKELTNLDYWIEMVSEIPINPDTGKSKMVIKKLD